MRATGFTLLILGLAILVARISGLLPFLESGLALSLIFIFPAIGAFLIFAARALSRPAGIDNDHIFQNQISGRGWTASVLGVLITSFYILIYFGIDINLSRPQSAHMHLDQMGNIITSDGAWLQDVRRQKTCPTGNSAIECIQRNHFDQYFPYMDTFHSSVQSWLNASGAPGKPIYFGYRYKYQVVAITKAEPMSNVISPILNIELQRQDTLHHWATRNVYSLLQPLATLLHGKLVDNWFVYGTLYTFMVLVFGVRMLLKYRHNMYQILRTFSVMFFQLSFAYLVPAFLKASQKPEFYFSYFWPLKPEYLWPTKWLPWLKEIADGNPGVYFLAFSAGVSALGVPIMTYIYGKRWYCSWVCGCGGLAETLGDPFRQLSDKSSKAWKIERWLIHSVLLAVIFVTALLWLNSLWSGAILGALSHGAARAYSFLIVSIFSGIVGVGFYPWLGSRVWCRFGCPMAAILGIYQKFFSRFRITTNGAQCISCGNCSTYCEMGIDVRWYAQRGQNIVRASCVGCGVCSAVCPRGVLKLENGPVTDRHPLPSLVTLK